MTDDDELVGEGEECPFRGLNGVYYIVGLRRVGEVGVDDGFSGPVFADAEAGVVGADDYVAVQEELEWDVEVGGQALGA